MISLATAGVPEYTIVVTTEVSIVEVVFAAPPLPIPVGVTALAAPI